MDNSSSGADSAPESGAGQGTETLKTVRVGELRPGMVIRDIVELSFDYATLDPAVVRFLHANFKGAKATLLKDSGEETVPVEQVAPFDNVVALLELPESLKVAKVVPGLARSMERHGFLRMRVVAPEGAGGAPADTDDAGDRATAAAEQRAARIAEAKRFIETVESANVSRDQAAGSVEEMLDLGRLGRISTKPVEAAITDLLEEGKTEGVKALAGLKASDQTYAHCVDMSVIFQEAYADILRRMGRTASSELNRFNLIAGFMHDVGKSRVPKDILESTKRFAPDSEEMLVLRNHTAYGAEILSDLGLHKTQINVAHFHHVKKDGSLSTSYPDVPYDDVLPLTRLGAIADVYQALIGRRRYKKNWVPGKAIEYLIKLRGSEFDETMLDHFIRSLGRFPLGSLLRLSTGDLAFVVRDAPEDVPDAPVVVVVENPQGELLTHGELIDLHVDPEVFVMEVVDHYEHYNESPDQAYQIFRAIQLP